MTDVCSPENIILSVWLQSCAEEAVDVRFAACTLLYTMATLANAYQLRVPVTWIGVKIAHTLTDALNLAMLTTHREEMI